MAIVGSALTALVMAACAGAPPPTGGATGSAPAPSVLGLDQLSLTPAVETQEPGPIGTPPMLPDLPPAPPPDGPPPPPPEVVVDYAGTPADLAGFVAAYREAFGIAELPDDAIAGAGARLCTYLQRQATPNGSVDLGRAITDADVNEPGYPRDVWEQAFHIAADRYCVEFSFAPGSEG